MFLNHLSLITYQPNEPIGSNVTVSSDWTHVVLNYVGSEDNGQNGGSDENFPHGDGRVVLGRFFIDRLYDSDFCGSFQVDELLFFDKSLSSSEILMLGQL